MRNPLKINCHPSFTDFVEDILDIIKDFDRKGSVLFDGRNKIKIFELRKEEINVKSFRVPNLVNRIAYQYFRKSKAQRSFEYADLLLKKGFLTPAPIAYVEETGLLFGKSFYVSRQLDYDLSFKDLNEMEDVEKRNLILEQFTEFTFRLHEAGVEFLDHSQGNTLMRERENGKYDFYLVDLNRMKFHRKMPLEVRLKNFGRLTRKKEMVEEMSETYARLTGEEFHLVFRNMWQETEKAAKGFDRRRGLKSVLRRK